MQHTGKAPHVRLEPPPRGATVDDILKIKRRRILGKLSALNKKISTKHPGPPTRGKHCA